MYFDGALRDTPIFARGALPAGFSLAGPAVIEEFGSTTVVFPGQHLAVDPHGTTLARRSATLRGDAPQPPAHTAGPFRFEGGKNPVYFVYGFKTASFWPFVPSGDGQERDNAEELELKAKLEKELPIEPDLTKWLALYNAPI